VLVQTGRVTRWKPDAPAAAWYVFGFFQNMWLAEPHVLEKACPIPPCRRRIGPVVQADAWFGTDRV